MFLKYFIYPVVVTGTHDMHALAFRPATLKPGYE